MNPLFDDQTVDFLLNECLELPALLRLPRYQMHSTEGLGMAIGTARRFARETLFPTLRPMDTQPPEFKDGRIHTHPELKRLYAAMVEAGYLSMLRPESAGGMQFPILAGLAIWAYLDAANLAATCYIGLSHGAAGLLETFGSADLKRTYMEPMYEGRYTGTMALTEPHAGSSLADVRTKATPVQNGEYLIEGEKVFISGGDNTFSENVVHLTLARIEGAPSGTKGVSLFCIPRLRLEHGQLVDNDARPSGLFHKMGWKGLPSIALKLGEEGRCHGYLVGEPNQGLRCMFQMMNGARLSVGLSATATASVAYHEALNYARTRPQGRALTNRDATTPQIPIIEHADVRRMLLAQKAIVEGSLALVLQCARYSDLAIAAESPDERERAQRLLDFLTPLAKTIPSERGFEANALSVQVHGGYGYTSEYLPELFLREQKLNTLHEGTTGIQSLDLLGRKIFGDAGRTAGDLVQEIALTITEANSAGLTEHAAALERASGRWLQVLATLGARAQGADIEGAMATSVWHLELAGILVMGWQWLRMATRAKRIGGAFAEGKLRACAYWFEAEISGFDSMAAKVEREKPAYLAMPDASF